MSDDILDCLSECVDVSLGIRDDLGIIIHKVDILKRTKASPNPELDGFDTVQDPVDILERSILPTPQIVQYKHDLRLKSGGAVREGDIMLKQISKNKFTLQDINCSRLDQEGKEIERFYLINEELYNFISIEEKYLWWNVLVRKIQNAELYLGN